MTLRPFALAGLLALAACGSADEATAIRGMSDTSEQMSETAKLAEGHDAHASAEDAGSQAVPLTPDLFDHTWTVIEYEGRGDAHGGGPTTFRLFDRQDGDAGGNTDCGTEWTAKIQIDLPSVKFSDVDAFYSDECPAYRNTVALLKALEQVTHAATTPEGLELRAADNRRLLLLNAGG